MEDLEDSGIIMALAPTLRPYTLIRKRLQEGSCHAKKDKNGSSTHARRVNDDSQLACRGQNVGEEFDDGLESLPSVI